MPRAAKQKDHWTRLKLCGQVSPCPSIQPCSRQKTQQIFKAEVSPSMAKVTFVGAEFICSLHHFSPARRPKVKSLGGFPPPDRIIGHSDPHPAYHLQTEKSSCAPSCHLDCLLGGPETCSTSLVLNSTHQQILTNRGPRSSGQRGCLY